jgi:hypothetical protein
MLPPLRHTFESEINNLSGDTANLKIIQSTVIAKQDERRLYLLRTNEQNQQNIF